MSLWYGILSVVEPELHVCVFSTHTLLLPQTESTTEAVLMRSMLCSVCVGFTKLLLGE